MRRRKNASQTIPKKQLLVDILPVSRFPFIHFACPPLPPSKVSQSKRHFAGPGREIIKIACWTPGKPRAITVRDHRAKQKHTCET